ncbi:MAG: 50S ribosomal protein L18e [Candidatus Diapherotrites archaeon]|uniref:50S ribosomal protein L18e n=1 Tax=Candidatus Iainarchaeum sp. TaxID=3101447 RepID=A0A8T5GF18_9ARCH|nr:50S ribosomal protein L18e [Candidatus Diapherotrites archaeon]MBT7241781.1 50S ribosomal protein L18e [Candidatus Diapherotrites archaeon]
MTKKLETQRLIASLEKTSRKTKKSIWKDLAKRIGKPTRNTADVNVEKLELLAKKFAGKTLVVPGKVLSKGELTTKTKIVAISASEAAVEKINQNGEFILLRDFVDEKVKVSELMIVK